MAAEDRCPYPRPFPHRFAACPAYVPRRWPAHGLDGSPLGAVWTCWHLVNGREGPTGAFYPRCALGDVPAREDWVQRAGPELVAAYRAFREAVVGVDDQLLAAADAPVDAPGIPVAEAASTAIERRRTIDRLLDQLRGAAAEHEHLLAGSGLAAEDWVRVTEDVLDHGRRFPGRPWRPGPALLERLTPAARRLVEMLAESAA